MSAVRVLCATQDAATVAFIRAALQGEEWPLEVVSDGDRCLAKFEKGAPDVVLVDLVLADMAGLDLVPKIHAIDEAVPVIVLGGSPSVEQAVVAMRRGAFNYLTRPFDAGKVVDAVRLALQEIWQKREVERLKSETGQGLSKVRVDEVLADLAVSGGSDLHLKVGRRPIYRIGGDLLESRFAVLDDDDVKGILLQVLGVEGFKVLERDLEYDTAYVLPGHRPVPRQRLQADGQVRGGLPHDSAGDSHRGRDEPSLGAQGDLQGSPGARAGHGSRRAAASLRPSPRWSTT
jgi:FixJ family two-component response regulator